MMIADGGIIGGTNNVILLPVAFHSHESGELIQIIGPPQTIVPVAVPRHCTLSSLLSHPLQIDSTAGVELASGSKLEIGVSPPSSQFYLRLAISSEHSRVTPALPSQGTIHNSSHSPTNITNSPSVLTTEQEEPLDLSLQQSFVESTERPAVLSSTGGGTSSAHASQPSTRKRLHCDCGLSFIAEETLRGHQSYYCRKRIPNVGGDALHMTHLSVIQPTPAKRKLVRPTTSHRACTCQTHVIQPLITCTKCEYEANSRLQLNRHERLAHTTNANAQGLVCPLCGCKGYSLRSARIHLRVAHANILQPMCGPTGLNAKLLETLLMQANTLHK